MQKLGIFLSPFIVLGCALTGPATIPFHPTEPTEKMIDGAENILLTVTEAPEEAYQNFLHFLIDNGFGFENTDQELLILKTDNKQIKNFSYSINLSINRDKETIIRVSGTGFSPKVGYFQIRNTGSKISYQKNLWENMQNLVSAYPHKKIMYKRN